MQLIYIVSIAVLYYAQLIENNELNGVYMGCFQHDTSATTIDFSLTINGTAAAQTVDTCLTACKDNYFRYAGIQNGQFCLCGSTFGSQGAAECSQNCYGNSSQLCGGLTAVSVYATGHLVPGPPMNLTVNQTEETRIGLVWDPPVASNGNLTSYVITADVTQTYSQLPLSARVWTYPASVRRAGLLSVFPGTQYNISLVASNGFGQGKPISILVWTSIADPPKPETPQVINKKQGMITVKLRPVINEFGPVTKYRIVVSSEENVIFSNKLLKHWREARSEKLPYYIAAELDPKEVTNDTLFVVGDTVTYGGYYNPPLQAQGEYFVSLGVVSTLHSVTKTNYSSTSNSQGGVILLDVPYEESDKLSTILKVAIVVSGILLALAVIVYVVIQKQFEARLYTRHDQQELNIRGPVTELENSAFVYDEYLPEEEDKKVDYYDMLHQRIWNIPRNFLDIQSEVIGEGSFGTIYRGDVQQNGQVTPITIYAIQDGELGSADKRKMLEDLDTLVRVGNHQNIVSLTGTCESQETLFIVLEHHPASLKDILLQSRCLQHGEYPKSRFCSLNESSLIEFVTGVADGMNFLTSKKVIHKQLNSSNILMANGLTPKIMGFGIANHHKKNKNQDYRRWSAQEVFTKKLHVSKSDVWSFGVVLWEACALGGTPYSDVSSDHIPSAVLRGARLPQLSYVGDTLYQLMLQCWQIDLDERPPFRQILSQLQSLSSSSQLDMELNFNTYKDFQYAVYSEDMEHY